MFCGTADEAKKDIIVALIKQMLAGGREFSTDALEDVVKEYHRKGKPVGYEHFYELPVKPFYEFVKLTQEAIFKGLKEGELKLVVK